MEAIESRIRAYLYASTYGIAISSSLPTAIKKMFSEATLYPEGRGIRFPVSSISDLPLIAKLAEIKTTPK